MAPTSARLHTLHNVIPDMQQGLRGVQNTGAYGVAADTLSDIDIVPQATRQRITEDEAVQRPGTRRATTSMPDTGLLGRDHVLNAVVDELWDSALAPATRDAYQRGFACFKRFAIMYLIPKNYVYNLPVINENTIVYFIVYCFHNLKLKFCTIKLYLAGIRYAYIRAGCANRLISNAGTPLTSVSNILNAVKRIQGQQRKTRLPITFNILCKIVYHSRKGVFSPYIDVMLEAACTLAFFVFLQCGEFTKTTNQFTPIPY